MRKDRPQPLLDHGGCGCGGSEVLAVELRRELRVLILEDSEDDAELLERALRAGGFSLQARRVQSAAELEDALAAPWDIILSDYRMPGFSAPEALRRVQQRRRDIPFVVVSGTVGEEAAVAVMRAGARDFFSKAHLGHLVPAVERELAEAAGRAERRRLEAARAFLVESAEDLHRSLDVHDTLERLCRIVVPRLGLLCRVYLADECGVLRQHAERRAEVDHDGVLARHAAALASLDLQALVGTRGLLRVPLAGPAATAPASCPATLLAQGLVAGDRAFGLVALLPHEPTDALHPTDEWLAHELGRRTSLALENARLYQAAQAAVSVRNDFIAVASHELRTPLLTFGLQLRTLERTTCGSELEQRIAPQFVRLQRQLARLRELVEKVLDVSLIEEPGAVRRAPCDLALLVRQRIEAMSQLPAASDTPLVVQGEREAWGLFDRERMSRAITSLLDNALKFGAGQPVEVTLECADGSASLTISDRGIGIRAEDRERIFGRFERAVSAQHYGGLGLGLFLARRVVEAHDGRIWAEGRPGGGAVITIQLPLDGGAREERAALQAPSVK